MSKRAFPHIGLKNRNRS